MFGLRKKQVNDNNELRMLSDQDIVSEIIDLDIAKGKYEGEDYKRFYNRYLEYSTNNEKFPTHNYQYRDRVLTITYEFAADGFDVGIICGENSEAFRVFNDGYEKLEDEAYSIIDGFSDVVDAIAEDNSGNLAACRGFAWALLHYALDFIRVAENFMCSTERVPCIFRASENMYMKFLMDNYYDKEDPWFVNAINDTKKATKDQFQEIIESESVIEHCLDRFVKTYMKNVRAQGDTTNYEKLKKIIIDDWMWLVLKCK